MIYDTVIRRSRRFLGAEGGSEMEETLQEYLDSLKGKKVAVLGIGVANTPLIKLLLRSGIRVTACD